jgi:hypothetical protein
MFMSKIIWARYYGISYEDVGPPRDSVDHGTHVASSAAKNIVSQASMLGLGQRTSRGVILQTFSRLSMIQ